MKYLFQVHIGPVQSFIASARRTRDLWFGSALLSHLAMKAAIALSKADFANATLIFPSQELIDMVKEARGQKIDNLSFPNKLLALIDVGDETKVALLGQALRTAIDSALEQIKNNAYKHAGTVSFDRALADRQIERLIEYRWVALPYEEDMYAAQREQLELLMAARKNTYDYAQFEKEEPAAKSSIDGQRECVIPQKYYPRRSYPPSPAQLHWQAALFKDFRAGPAERLSGVDLLKRRGDFQEEKREEEGFPSTSHIATIPYLARLLQLNDDARIDVWELWERYIEELQKLNKKKNVAGAYEQVLEHVRGYAPLTPELYPHPIFDRYDGSLLFPEHFLEVVTASKDLTEARQALNNFFASVTQQLGQQLVPQPYYAIIQADGDSMGNVISHEAGDSMDNALSHEATHGRERHQALSAAIDHFAGQARMIVCKNDGATIYAGGDDVLALVPIHRVLACAAQLASTFKKLLKDFEDKTGKKPSLSVGIAIVHHLELLSEARNIAVRAEKGAKKLDGKDALSIIVSKRSGEAYAIAGKWEALAPFLCLLIPCYLNQTIPKGMAYELRAMALRLDALRSSLDGSQNTPIDRRYDKKVNDKLIEVLKTEAGRILRRKLLVPREKTTRIGKEQTIETFTILAARLALPLAQTLETLAHLAKQFELPAERALLLLSQVTIRFGLPSEEVQKLLKKWSQQFDIAIEQAQDILEWEKMQIDISSATEQLPDKQQKGVVQPVSTIETFVHELVIAQLLAEAIDLAGIQEREIATWASGL